MKKKCTEKYAKKIENASNALSLLSNPKQKSAIESYNKYTVSWISSMLEGMILTKHKDLTVYISAGVFDGANEVSKLTRQLFIELTGVTLPKSAKATRVKLEKYIATKSEAV